MNLFRKLQTNEDLTLKIESLESLVNDLQVGYTTLQDSNKDLTEKVSGLMDELKQKEEVIEEKQETIHAIVEQMEELEVVVEKKEDELQEILETVVSVEKQASIKALEILAESGHEVVETIDGPEVLDIMSQMKGLKEQELVDFWKKNREEVLKNLKH